MNVPLPRREFSKTLLAGAAAALVGGPSLAYAAKKPKPPAEPKVPTSPMPPLTVTPVPEAFESRYEDLGGVLDLTNGVIWGYEPYASLANYGIGFNGGPSGVHQGYLNLLAAHAISGTPEENAIFATAYAIAAQRTWLWPTVFEARDATAKGLFTFGEDGLNLYYGSPAYEVPAVSYGVGNLRWTSSEIKQGRVHVWSAGDGGTLLTAKTSALLGIVVSKLA